MNFRLILLRSVTFNHDIRAEHSNSSSPGSFSRVHTGCDSSAFVIFWGFHELSELAHEEPDVVPARDRTDDRYSQFVAERCYGPGPGTGILVPVLRDLSGARWNATLVLTYVPPTPRRAPEGPRSYSRRRRADAHRPKGALESYQKVVGPAFCHGKSQRSMTKGRSAPNGCMRRWHCAPRSERPQSDVATAARMGALRQPGARVDAAAARAVGDAADSA